MRIRCSDVILKLTVKNSSKQDSNPTFEAYNADLHPLAIRHSQSGDMHSIEITTQLPSDLILKFSNAGHGLELVRLSLVGIAINKEILSNRVEYKQTHSLEDIKTVASKKTLLWPKDGCAIFNFFHHDPFAYHLFIGNKIKML